VHDIERVRDHMGVFEYEFKRERGIESRYKRITFMHTLTNTHTHTHTHIARHAKLQIQHTNSVHTPETHIAGETG
jgi:hypothetical protein